MKYVLGYIQDKQACFARTPFFHHLDQLDSPEHALSFIRRLTFFVMVFQDILRLNESIVQDATLRGIARHHRAEDRGHEQWFLHDVAKLEGSIPDAREIFSTNTVTRDAAYQLMSEVFRAEDDHARIALLLVLESTGHVFFSRVVANIERLGITDKLLYFSRKHLDIELGHELFEEEMKAVVSAIELDPSKEEGVLALVDRSFDAMTKMIEALDDRANLQSVPSSPRSSLANVAPASAVLSRRWLPEEMERKRVSSGAE